MPTHHAIDYIEFRVPDVAATKTFFHAAFGWEFNDYGADYAGIKGPEDGEVGGIARGEAGDGGPLVVLFSEDLEASLAAVAAAGGQITKPVFEFPGGRRFEFREPGGNGMAVWGSPQ